MKEVWKPVPGHEDTHLVSNLGRFKSLDYNMMITSRGKSYLRTKKGQIVKARPKGLGKQNGHEYYTVGIGIRPTGTRNELSAHRVVAKAFIPNPDNKPQVNHKNGKKGDNRVVNLEWVTEKENIAHARKKGFIKSKNKK